MPSKRRILALFTIFLSVFLLLNIKFVYLQFFAHNKFYKQAADQRSMSIKISDNRGIIFDRNFIPLVNNNPVKYAVVFPEFITNSKEVLRLLKKAAGSDNIQDKLKAKKPFAEKMVSFDEALLYKLEENNIFVVDGYERYGENNLTRHIIGYTAAGDGHGRTGIEKAYDKFLYSTRGKYIGIVSDALHHQIEGLGVRYVDEKEFRGEFDVKLTIDFHIQQLVEKYMDKNSVSGAVAVLKVSDGDIVAMASRPQFRQDAIEEYIDSSGTELVNRALNPFNAGSIFKIVVSAAAFENGTSFLTDTFYCAGERKVQDRYFRCTSSHGLIDLTNAFAVSCNSAFIDLGIRTGKENILDMAKKLGFGSFSHLNELGINESKGELPGTKYTSEKEIANIAIGQGDILVTPLQVASMVATVANNGVKTNVNLVDSIIDSDGRFVKRIKSTENKRVFSVQTASKLKIMMEKVTEVGTGKKANIQSMGGAAGKTGTAQTGWRQGDSTKIHGWFAGYFPIKDPQYALVVFVENGQSGSEVAAPIFGEIASEIMKLGRR